MLHPHSDGPADDDAHDGESDVERSISRFHKTLSNVEGHKRRLIDASGWWLIRALLVFGCIVLVVLSRPIEAAICAAAFLVTLFFR